MILENNPFYAASLTPRAGGGFELINYDPVGKETTYSTSVMRTIGRNGPQVNVKFSVKPEGGLAIDSFDIFEKGVKVLSLPLTRTRTRTLTLTLTLTTEPDPDLTRCSSRPSTISTGRASCSTTSSSSPRPCTRRSTSSTTCFLALTN